MQRLREKNQRKCINELNKNGAKVAKAQSKENVKCIKHSLTEKVSSAEAEGGPTVAAGGLAFFARRHGAYLHAAARPEKGAPPERFRLAFRPAGDPRRARALQLVPGDLGLAYRDEILRDGQWLPVRRKKLAGARPAGLARGEATDHRSDLFSFGVMLYEMASGRLPFQGRSDVEALSATIATEPQPLSQVVDELPAETERVVRPLRVHERQGNLYLLAHCYRAEALRTFRLDRVVELASEE